MPPGLGLSPPTSWSAYRTPPAGARALGVVCLGMGGQSGPVGTVRTRTLDHYAVVVVEHGSGWLQHGQRRTALPTGSVFWLFPGVVHSYGPDAAGWSERWVLFDAGPGVLDRPGLLRRAEPVDRPARAEGVRRLLAEMRTSLSWPDAVAELALGGAVLQLVAEVARSRGDADADVLDALRQRADQPLSTAEHARDLGLPVERLRTLVRSATGGSPKAFLVAERLNRAKQLLAGSDLTVREVARRVGYDDPAYFSRTFASHVGTAPSVFRSRFLRDDEPGGR